MMLTETNLVLSVYLDLSGEILLSAIFEKKFLEKLFLLKIIEIVITKTKTSITFMDIFHVQLYNS